MNKFRAFYIICFFSFQFVFIVGAQVLTQSGLSVEAYAPEYPVLAGKKYNPVFRMHVRRTNEKSSELRKVSVDVSQSTALKDIEKITIFYTGDQPGFSSDKIFAETDDVSNQVELSNELILEDSSHYFWLSITLSEEVDIDHVVNAFITEVEIDNEKISIDPDETSTTKRLGVALRQAMDEGVHTYRIPGLATTNEGTLIAVYDIRRNSSVDLQEDIDVGMSRSTDGGKTWESMKVIMDKGTWGNRPEKENGVGDPSILVDRETNTVWVAALWLHGSPDKRAWFASEQGMTPEETGQLILVKSEDDGVTWSDPINITSQVKNPKWHLLLDGPGKGITMEDGTLVFPAQFKDENEVPHSTVIYSKDRGKSWTIGTGAKSHTTESQVVELADHSLMLNMRDDRGNGPNGKTGTGARSVAITRDLGKTWTEHPTSRKALPEPVCMGSLIKHHHKGKTLLLFSNPDDQYKRHHMTIKVSMDQGMTWHEKYHTLIDEGKGYGYSCLTSIDEETIGIIYEGSQAHMVFQRIPIRELLGD